MLDAPSDEDIYSTNKCYEQIHDFVVKMKIKEIMLFTEELQKRADTIPPNLLLNEIVNYAYDRKEDLLPTNNKEDDKQANTL
jgi:hypothetical protein